MTLYDKIKNMYIEIKETGEYSDLLVSSLFNRSNNTDYNSCTENRSHGWSAERLERHANVLEKMIKKGTLPKSNSAINERIRLYREYAKKGEPQYR